MSRLEHCRPGVERLRPTSGRKGRVLVVDDDASLAEMLIIVLRQEGFEGRIQPEELDLPEYRLGGSSPSSEHLARGPAGVGMRQHGLGQVLVDMVMVDVVVVVVRVVVAAWRAAWHRFGGCRG